MVQFWPRHVARLTRIDSSLFIFSVVFIPLVFRGFGTAESLQLAVPLLTISMCAFALNDIRDVDRDRINHPERPLVSGGLSMQVAMGVYFAMLVGTLIWMRIYIDVGLIWPYILYLLILINYNFVIDEFPYLKNFTVSIAILMPVVILDKVLYGRIEHFLVLSSVFLFILAREILMDVRDSKGDGNTFFKLLGQQRATVIAFGTQAFSIIILVTGNTHWPKILIGIVLLILLVVCTFVWFRGHKRFSIGLMKLQLIAGVAYLL